MNRRRLLAATAGTATLAGCLDAFGTGGADDDSSDTADADAGSDGPPYEIETIDAPGSEAGTIAVPRPGRLTLLNFTRQNCPTSAGFLENFGDASDRLSIQFDVAPDGDLVIASVIDWTSLETPADEELADWWREHDGHWPIGIDRSGALFDAYHGPSYPGTVVIDGDGEVQWADTGGTTASNVVRAVREAAGIDPDEDGAENDESAADDAATGD